MKIKLLVVDDHVMFREGLVSLFQSQPDFEVVGQAGTVKQAVYLVQQLNPDMVLMDFNLPDGTGLEATRAILADNPTIEIVFLTIYEENEKLYAAIRAGAKGYMLKNLPVAKLLNALRGVKRGEAAVTREMTARIMEEFSRTGPAREIENVFASNLTDREREVLREITAGATNQEIADRLFVSVNTVKNHVSNILAKLNLNNRREVALFAKRHNIV